MIVAGTGISPMLQALHCLLGTEDDDTRVWLLYGSRNQDEILAKAILDAWDESYDQLTVIHSLSREPVGSRWHGRRGRVDKELLLEYAPPPSAGAEVIFFVCGPLGMYDDFCGQRGEKELSGHLKNLGYDASQVVKF